jgi:predicted DNA-binding transcriptional regulator AlpA
MPSTRPTPRIKSRRCIDKGQDGFRSDWLRRDESAESTARLLFKKQLLEVVPLSFPTIWKMMRAGTFPRRLVVGGKTAWHLHEIEAWMKALPQRRYLGDDASNNKR